MREYRVVVATADGVGAGAVVVGVVAVVVNLCATQLLRLSSLSGMGSLNSIRCMSCSLGCGLDGSGSDGSRSQMDSLTAIGALGPLFVVADLADGVHGCNVESDDDAEVGRERGEGKAQERLEKTDQVRRGGSVRMEKRRAESRRK